MKKFVSLLLGAAFLSSLFVVSATAAPVRGPSRITAPQVESMEINGIRGPEYGTEYFIIDQLHYPITGITSASTGRAWFAWSTTHIFGFIEVADTTPVTDFPGGFFRQDGVEIYFDWNNAIIVGPEESAFGRVTIGAAPFTASADYQATLRRQNLGDIRASHMADEIRTHLEFYTNQTDAGFVIEFALCLEWALQHPVRPGEAFAVGREIGVEIMLNDNQYPAHAGDRAWSAIRGFPAAPGTGAGPNNIGAVIVLGEAVPADATPVATPAPVVTPAPEVTGGPAQVAPGNEVDKVPTTNIPDTSDVVTITFGVAIVALLAVAFVVRKKVTA